MASIAFTNMIEMGMIAIDAHKTSKCDCEALHEK
jgi:hypothetical protein